MHCWFRPCLLGQGHALPSFPWASSALSYLPCIFELPTSFLLICFPPSERLALSSH
jgi:hypothetical protein